MSYSYFKRLYYFHIAAGVISAKPHIFTFVVRISYFLYLSIKFYLQMKRTALILAAVFSAFIISSCGSDKKKTNENTDTTSAMKQKVDEYAVVEL